MNDNAFDDYDDEDELRELVLVDIFGMGEDDGEEDQAEENDGPASHYPCPLSDLLSKEEYLKSVEDREILEPLPDFPEEPLGDTMREEWVRVVRVTAYELEENRILFLLVKQDDDPPLYASAEAKDGNFIINELSVRPPLPIGDYNFG